MQELYGTIEEVKRVQDWLQRFIVDHKSVITSEACGICIHVLRGEGSFIVRQISSAIQERGYIINDINSGLTPKEQYADGGLYTGDQLQLRKEYAKMLIEYLDEAIKV